MTKQATIGREITMFTEHIKYANKSYTIYVHEIRIVAQHIDPKTQQRR